MPRRCGGFRDRWATGLPISSAWTHGPESNRCMTRFANERLTVLATVREIVKELWYPARDLNPHARRRCVLSAVCLPFHQRGLKMFWD